MVGAVVITAFVNREKIGEALDNVLGRSKQSVVKDEHSERG